MNRPEPGGEHDGWAAAGERRREVASVLTWVLLANLILLPALLAWRGVPEDDGGPDVAS